MKNPDTESLTVEAFISRHRLDTDNFFALIHDHPVLLPEVIDAGEGLRIIEYSCASSEVYSKLPAISQPLPPNTATEDTLTAKQFCDRYRIGPEGLLRLTLAGNLPVVFGHAGALVFLIGDVRNWERLNGLRMLQRAQGGAR